MGTATIVAALPPTAGAVGGKVDLAGSWRVKVGDGPNWAAEGLDDTGWPTAVLPGTWEEQRLRGVDGPIWYRRVVVPEERLGQGGAEGWGLLLGRTRFGTVDVWINGTRVGPVGRRANPVPVPTLRLMAVPAASLARQDHLAIAIRVTRVAWASDRAPNGGPVGRDLAFGRLEDLASRVELDRRRELMAAVPLLFASVVFIGVAVAFAYLWLRWRSDAEHLWFSLVAAGFGANTFLNSPWVFELTDQLPLVVRLTEASGALLPAAFIQFLWTYLKRPLPSLLRAYQASFGLLAAAILFTPDLGWVVDTQNLRWLWLVPLLVSGLYVVVAEARGGNKAARGVILAGFLLAGAELLAIVGGVLGWVPPVALEPAWAFSVFIVAMGVVILDRLNGLRVELDAQVTSLALARRALRDSEQRLRLVLDTTDELFVLWDRKGPGEFRVAVANRAFKDFVNNAGSGPEAKELEGGSYESTSGRTLGLDSQALKNDVSRLEEAATSGRPHTYEMTIAAATGELCFETSILPVLDDAGRCTRLLQVLRDVTERKRSEERQSRLQQQVRAAATEWTETFDAVESALIVTATDGIVRRLNVAARDLAGTDSWENLIGRRLADLGGGEPWRTAARLAERAATESRAVAEEVHDDETGRVWALDAARLRSAPDRVITIVRDITAFMRLQEAVQRRETMSAMGALVGGVAHEVRNPLFGISGLLDTVEAKVGSSDELGQYFEALRREIDRLGGLMRALLEFGRPISEERTALPMALVAREATQLCRRDAVALGVHLVVDVPETLPAVPMDRSGMVEVLRNLLENAVQHSPAGATVAMSARRLDPERPGWLEVAVKDSGPGFDEVDAGKVFEPFYSRRRGGAGLGLSIVRRVVTEHGGDVQVGNRPEGGAVVRVQLRTVDG